MEDELDLRTYIATVLRYKYWIIGLAVLAAVAALVISLVMPPVYEATALVAVIAPRYTMQFDPRFEASTNVSQPYKAYPSLAMGDDALAALGQELGDELSIELGPGPWAVADLRKRLSARNSTDPSIIELRARFGNPQRAATAVNRWAELFVTRVNDLYGQDAGDLTFYEGQLTDAQSALSRAEQDLIDFQARNEAAILETQLDSQKASMEEYLRAERSLHLIVQDAQSLLERLSAQDPALRGTLSDDLASLLLQVDAMNRESLPIQLQISGQQGLTERTVGEQISFLEALTKALENRQSILDGEAKALEPGILSLQERLEQVNVEANRLSSARDLAEETFVSLSRKVAEARIAAQNSVGDVRVASQALPPDKPASPRKLLNTGIAGALGLVVGIVGALAVEYWRRGGAAR